MSEEPKTGNDPGWDSWEDNLAGAQGWDEDGQVGNILPLVVKADTQEGMLRRENKVSVPCF